MGLLPPWRKEQRNGHTYKVPAAPTATIPTTYDLWVIVEVDKDQKFMRAFGPVLKYNHARTLSLLWSLRSEGVRYFVVQELYDISTNKGLGE